MGGLVAMDVFTSEIWMKAGLVTYDMQFFIHLASMTSLPDARWVAQIAGDTTMAGWGFLQLPADAE
jgi:hypothetical protein